MDASQPSRVLLQRVHRGDQSAIGELIDRNLEAVHAYVRRELRSPLRQKMESLDIVQDALMEFLRYGPRFLVTSEEHFRSLLCRIALNVIRGKYDWFQAERRRLARERPLPSDSVLQLDPPHQATDPPPEHLQARDRQACVRMALELLSPEDQQVILMREFEQLSFVEIGERLEIAEDTARMRFRRALPRYGDVLRKIWEGRITELL